MKKEWLANSVLVLLFQGCIIYENDPVCSQYDYYTFDELNQSIRVEAPHEIEKAGKIYIYENLVLVSDSQKGVHIIDNSDKHTPENKLFVRIPGNIDIAVKEGYMYVDNYTDLVVMDITDLDNVHEVTRQEGIFAYNVYNSDNNTYEQYLLASKCGYDLYSGFVVEKGEQ